MFRYRAWQKGAADLVTVAVGMVILSIVVVGTSASMILGREALLRQEHYKAAAYLLRGEMEAEIMQLQLVAQARTSQYRSGDGYRPKNLPLDLVTDREGVRVVNVTITRDPIEEVLLPETGDGVDYYVITMHARWLERDLAGNPRNIHSDQLREISMKTAAVVRGQQ